MSNNKDRVPVLAFRKNTRWDGNELYFNMKTSRLFVCRNASFPVLVSATPLDPDETAPCSAETAVVEAVPTS